MIPQVLKYNGAAFGNALPLPGEHLDFIPAIRSTGSLSRPLLSGSQAVSVVPALQERHAHMAHRDLGGLQEESEALQRPEAQVPTHRESDAKPEPPEKTVQRGGCWAPREPESRWWPEPPGKGGNPGNDRDSCFLEAPGRRGQAGGGRVKRRGQSGGQRGRDPPPQGAGWL